MFTQPQDDILLTILRFELKGWGKSEGMLLSLKTKPTHFIQQTNINQRLLLSQSSLNKRTKVSFN